MRCNYQIRNDKFCDRGASRYGEGVRAESIVHKKSPSPVDKHVGSRIRMRRMMLGFSQEKLGDALGLTFQQVQKYEKGANRVGASRLLQIARILGVGVEYFYEGLPQGPGEAPRHEPMLEFLTIPESERLVRNFVQLKDDVARRKVTDLVEWLAAAVTAETRKGPA
jgi:transcriptional regulator with XRE-family HTH domain